MFFINHTAIIVYSRLHVSTPLLSPCYSTIAERRPVDRTPSHLSPAAMLPFPLYSHKFPLSSIHFRQRMLVVMASASNRHFDLAILGQNEPGGIGRNWETSSAVFLTTYGPFPWLQYRLPSSPLQQTKGHETVIELYIHDELPDNRGSAFYPYCHYERLDKVQVHWVFNYLTSD